jgi:mannosyl-3-phosphoglycerate phosphatase
MSPLPWVAFTDLDESLLDREAYSFEAARPALEELRRQNIPLVLCTSKTAAETLRFRTLLENRDPFVVEGGGGIYIPKGYFDKLPRSHEDRGEYLLLPLGRGHEDVLKGLGHLKEFTANSIRAFDDMTAEEIAADTRLPLELARLAKDREFDEPFKFVRREGEFAPHLSRVAGERSLRVTRGGRYYHLHGEVDKGMATQTLIRLFAQKLGRVRTLAVGDSEMDFPMLGAVDVPIAVLRENGRHDPVLTTGVKDLLRVPRPGPAGWNDAVLQVLKDRVS